MVRDLEAMIDDLLAVQATSRTAWLVVLAGVTMLAFALPAFACDRLGYKFVSPFLAAGAWPSAGFGALVWFWR
jgi:hypothetical protein